MKTFDIPEILDKIRKTKPVVHHLTNWVTIYDCANIVKTLGGSPIMAHAPEEIDQIVSIASSVVLNIGTLTIDFVESMKLAARAASIRKIPVILDVCGAGATELRNRKIFELIEYAHIDIIKGNASEVANVAGRKVFTKGVDSSDVSIDLIEVAESLAKQKSCVVVITGKYDIVSDGNKTFYIKNGHGLLTCVVGTGCMVSSVIGTFAAVEKNLLNAAIGALVCFGIASEIAAEQSKGPASFKMALFDVLYGLDREKIESRMKLEKVK
ncbi:MAG TPA: hydroxyethylthiazole kinase [bacterium]|nr:hydroxyethylthiazole kinase [bacterium]HOL35582.1 hydroxyethylthiazole kinase [bacterium]HPO52679.1 hydroxyethylthiazole kinase [bacterium]